MSVKSGGLWAGTLGGLVVGGLLAAAMSMTDLPFSTAIGAFVGGVVAAYVLFGKIGQAVAAGALSGILVTPFFLGVLQILVIFNVIPIPSSPTPPLSELQAEVMFIFTMNLLAGAVGGAVTGAIRHPSTGTGTPPSPPPETGPTQIRYCVQCGAQLPAGAEVCPHCNIKQPQ